MRFFAKLLCVLTMALAAQVGYEVVWSLHAYPLEAYGINEVQANQALETEHKLNACNFVTRRIVSSIIAIPLPGEMN